MKNTKLYGQLKYPLRGMLYLFLPLMVLIFATPAWARNPDGTLHLIRWPSSTFPALVVDGGFFEVALKDIPAQSSVELDLVAPWDENTRFPLQLSQPVVEGDMQYRTASLPPNVPEELYHLHLRSSVGEDFNRIAVRLFHQFPEDFYFAHYSDSQSFVLRTGHSPKFPALLDAVDLANPVFAVNTGDLTSFGTFDEYSSFVEAVEAGVTPTFHVPGNHDIAPTTCNRDQVEEHQQRWEDFIGPRTFSFNFGPHQFVSTEVSLWKYRCTPVPVEQPELLEDALASYEGDGLRFVLVHQPEVDSDILNPLLDRYLVDMVLYGHIHKDKVEELGTTPTIWAAVAAVRSGRFRVVRVAGNDIVSYTYDGDSRRSTPASDAITLTYDGPNDGSRPYVTARFRNPLNELFDRVRIQFVLPQRWDSLPLEVSGGEVYHQVEHEDWVRLWVDRVVEPESTAVVSVRVPYQGGDDAGGDPSEDVGVDGGRPSDGDGGMLSDASLHPPSNDEDVGPIGGGGIIWDKDDPDQGCACKTFPSPPLSSSSLAPILLLLLLVPFRLFLRRRKASADVLT